MKKIIITSALLTGVVAMAQVQTQTTESAKGKVGINTETPKATLEIQPNADNAVGSAKTNEGLLIPRLTKARVAGIDEANRVDGTLVYVTDAVLATDNTTFIGTGKGFYYYDDATKKWIKQSDEKVGPAGLEWVYDASKGRISLKRSGGNGFTNSDIFYNENGYFINKNTDTYSLFSIDKKATETVNMNWGNEFTDTLFKKITADTKLISGVSDTGIAYARNTLDSKTMYVEDNSGSGTFAMTGTTTNVRTAPTNTKAYFQLIGSGGTTNHDGTGNAQYMIGGYFDGRLNRGSSSGYVVGTRVTASYETDKSSTEQTGVKIFNQALATGSGTIRTMYDINASNAFHNDSPLNVDALNGVYIANGFKPNNGAVKFGSVAGFNYGGLNPSIPGNYTVAKNYGLFLGDISSGTVSNHAIYTNAGQIRFGDLAGTNATSTDATAKIVVADADGVLKTVAPSSLKGITAEVDGVIGNEVTNATEGGGLVRSGNGTANSPYTLGLAPGTVDGQTLVWNAGTNQWVAQAPASGASLSALTGTIYRAASITAEEWETKGVFAYVQTGTDTIKLPNPANYKNKIIAVNNNAGQGLNYAGTYYPAHNSTIDGGKGHILMSDGTDWYVIGGSY